jgi:CDP-diacylglycerol--glycerol-3-phosphate 3-phosphatidyltransferase
LSALNLPNTLTLIRIFLVPLLVVVLLTRWGGPLLGPAIFGAAVATDWLDGYLARRRNQITRLGILLDPLADKLLVSAALLSLVEMDIISAWVVWIIIGREFAVTGLRSFAAQRGVLMASSLLGKWKMVLEVTAISLLLIAHHYPLLMGIAKVSLWVAVAVALASGIDYFKTFWREANRGSKPLDAA